MTHEIDAPVLSEAKGSRRLARPATCWVPTLLSIAVGAGPALTSPLAAAPQPAVSVPAAAATAVIPTAHPDSLKVGLVLSGGGAKGFAHIGVLRVLEDAGVEIDAIAGTSMGALLGALYSIGYTPEMLERIAEEQNWDALFTDEPERDAVLIETKLADRSYPIEFPIRRGLPRLPRGLASGQRIEELITRLTWSAHDVRDFRSLPIPFVAVATDVETGQAVRLQRGVLPRALRASISIPSVFAPIEIDGRTFMDGGVSRNLPAEDVVDLGADFLICVDVSEPLHPADSLRTFLEIVGQTIAFRQQQSNREQRRLCDVLIEPRLLPFTALAFERAPLWIESGATAARAALPRILRRVAPSPNPRAGLPERPGPPDSARVSEIRVEGLEVTSRRFVRGILNLDVPGWVRPREVDRAVARLYSTDLYADIGYWLDGPADSAGAAGAGAGAGRVLAVRVKEEAQDRLALAYRYDAKYKTSLLLSARLHNLLRFGSVTRVDLRVGEQLALTGEHWRRSGPGRAVHLGVRGGYSRTPFEIFEGGRRVAEVNTDVFELSGFAGLAILDAVLAGVRVKGEYASGRANVAPEAIEENRAFYTLGGIVRVETLDRDFFPTRGIALDAKSEWADDSFGSGATFSHNVLVARAYLPLRARISLLAGAALGTASGPDLPFHYLFFLGGANPYYIFPDRHFTFPGLETQERRGRQLQSFRLGVQLEASERVLAAAMWNSGNTFERWSFAPSRYINGYALLLGVRTVFGNAWVTLAETDLDEAPDLSLDLGFRF